MLYGRLGAPNRDDEPAREKWFIFVIRKGSAFKSKKPSQVQMKRFKFCTLDLELPARERYFPFTGRCEC